MFRKVFGGAGILPERVHRLKTCATKFNVGCAPRTIYGLLRKTSIGIAPGPQTAWSLGL